MPPQSDHTRHHERFQSLLSWMLLSNLDGPHASGPALEVSILVILDVALKQASWSRGLTV